MSVLPIDDVLLKKGVNKALILYGLLSIIIVSNFRYKNCRKCVFFDADEAVRHLLDWIATQIGPHVVYYEA